jgi:hypothetical protein
MAQQTSIANTREVYRWRSHASHPEYVARISPKKVRDVGTQAGARRRCCKTESESIDRFHCKEEMGKGLEGHPIFFDARLK